MLVAPSNSKIAFVKMSGAGNDFVIIDNREQKINLSTTQVALLSERKNIGCDQLIVIENGATNYDCEMIIYNSDGSKSAACGNATRCVAAIIMAQKNTSEVKIKTAAGILKCWRYEQNPNLISVAIAIPTFVARNIPMAQELDTAGFVINEENLQSHKFFALNVGNPHCISFIEAPLSDKEFFNIGPQIEHHQLFPQKTNVEFAQILSDDLINVRVWERGVGETLACGTGACAVAVAAIKNNLIKSTKVTIRFKGGDLLIEWSGEGQQVIMTGDYKKIFDGTIDLSLFDA